MPKDNLKEFLAVKKQTDTEAELYFYGDIVSSWWGAWDDTDQYPESIKNFLDEVKGKKLNIHINSGGGSVFAGITIYNMLKNYKGEKIVYIDGTAASIASVIAMAGDRVIMRTGSSLMIHKPLIALWGGYNADDMRKMAEDLDQIQKCIMQVYKENTKLGADISKIEELVNSETWLTSDEAEKYFNIEIENMQAVACESDYIEKLLKKPSASENKEKEESINIKNKLQIELNLLSL